jgi:hypothetical protein
MRQQGYRVPGPRQAPRAAPARCDRQGQLCGWCGGAGTHYLTCRTLRLPSGYRVSGDAEPRCLCGLEPGTCGVRS